MQWSKDDGSTSSFWTLVIPGLPRFEKLSLSQFKVYIETETMTHLFVCSNCQKTILIRSAEGKERFFCILHMLRIHNGLRKLIKKNVYDLHILKNNPFKIVKPWIIIVRIELLFEQYSMALKQDKYNIEAQNDDAIKRNWIFSDFIMINRRWCYNY